MSELGDAIERLELWARGEEFDELTAVIAAARERDALAAVIEEARRIQAPGRTVGMEVMYDDPLGDVLFGVPSDALVERDARIRAEVIDWFDEQADRQRSGEAADVLENAAHAARKHFGLKKENDRG